MGPILATREMSWTRDDGVIHSAFVDVGVPYQDDPREGDTGPVWCCNVRTRGLGNDSGFANIRGVDAIQALYLALVHAGSRVSASMVADRLDWAKVPNFGFPIPPVIPDIESWMDDGAAEDAQRRPCDEESGTDATPDSGTRLSGHEDINLKVSK